MFLSLCESTCTTYWSLEPHERYSCATHTASLHTAWWHAVIGADSCTLKFYTENDTKNVPISKGSYHFFQEKWRQYLTKEIENANYLSLQRLCLCSFSFLLIWAKGFSDHIYDSPQDWKCVYMGWKEKETAEVRKMPAYFKMLKPWMYSQDFFPLLAEDSLRVCLFLYIRTYIHKHLSSMHWLNNYPKNWLLELPDQFK